MLSTYNKYHSKSQPQAPHLTVIFWPWHWLYWQDHFHTSSFTEWHWVLDCAERGCCRLCSGSCCYLSRFGSMVWGFRGYDWAWEQEWRLGRATNTTLGGGAAEGCRDMVVVHTFNDWLSFGIIYGKLWLFSCCLHFLIYGFRPSNSSFRNLSMTQSHTTHSVQLAFRFLEIFKGFYSSLMLFKKLSLPRRLQPSQLYYLCIRSWSSCFKTSNRSYQNLHMQFWHQFQSSMNTLDTQGGWRCMH